MANNKFTEAVRDIAKRNGERDDIVEDLRDLIDTLVESKTPSAWDLDALRLVSEDLRRITRRIDPLVLPAGAGPRHRIR